MGEPEIDPKAAAINEYQRLMMQHKVRVSSFIARRPHSRDRARSSRARCVASVQISPRRPSLT
mgnify:CR=1 FL=1|jgi:hypothetical protein|tara:strand:+ start:441 stop:629 length:189 start_codon:yes stop_codon:yes gene_type:complete